MRKNPIKGIALWLLALLSVALSATAQGADEKLLDSAAANKLTADHTWAQKPVRGPGFLYWSWKGDGTACLRTDEPKGKCADTGTWKMDAERVCYNLTWWGESTKLKSACFRIADKGKGKYAMVMEGGITSYEFSVMK